MLEMHIYQNYTLLAWFDSICNFFSFGQGVPMESNSSSKLIGCRIFKNRFFDLLNQWRSDIFYLSTHVSFTLEIRMQLCFLFLLVQVTAIVLSNLNKIIDINYYSVETAKRSNLCHRPFGIGVQGLADTFILHGMAFDSPEVKLILA